MCDVKIRTVFLVRCLMRNGREADVLRFKERHVILVKKLIAQFMKFGVVGVIAFIIDYGLMVFLTEAFNVPYLISNTISFIASVVFNYLASMRYVFVRKDDMSRKKEFVIFVLLSVIGLILNDVLMWVFVGLLVIDYRISKIIVTALVSLWNFFSRKAFLEDKSAH